MAKTVNYIDSTVIEKQIEDLLEHASLAQKKIAELQKHANLSQKQIGFLLV